MPCNIIDNTELSNTDLLYSDTIANIKLYNNPKRNPYIINPPINSPVIFPVVTTFLSNFFPSIFNSFL